MLTAFPVPGKRKSAYIVAAFIVGAPRDAVGAVFYGVTEGNAAAWRAARARQKADGTPWYYIDNSYFDAVRGQQYRVTKNALQHDGVGISDGKRFDKLGVPIEHYRGDAGYILVVPQSDGFMRDVVGMRAPWSEVTANELKAEPAVKWRPWSPDKLALQKSLRHDLERARLLVTYSSAAAVQAALMGVKVSVSADSCAWCFSGLPVAGDRERWRWASVLADNQWTLDEIRSGMAWETING